MAGGSVSGSIPGGLAFIGGSAFIGDSVVAVGGSSFDTSSSSHTSFDDLSVYSLLSRGSRVTTTFSTFFALWKPGH